LYQYSFAKKLPIQIVTREKLQKTLLHENVAHEMLEDLIPVVNFTNILQAVFVPILFAKKYKAKLKLVKSCRKTLPYKNAAFKMLENFIPDCLR